ncbi:hypothetical protein JT359_12670, partial [Candidatus Poribacteria bacterium]|nr:hypothetical protein [Candidatus Poribacteria bacterium]
IEAINAGEPDHKIASIVGEATQLPPSTIRRWAKRYNWREHTTNNNPILLSEQSEIQYSIKEPNNVNHKITGSVETITYTGYSGIIYPFEIHRLGTEFPLVGAVYIFTRKIISRGKTIHDPLYIGQTDSLQGKFCEQRNFNCVKKYGVEFICINRVLDEIHRRQIVTDLRIAHNAICNV